MFIRIVPLTAAIAAVLSFSLPCTAVAQDRIEFADPKQNLDRIVVTATRTAVTTDAALAPVEVIDRDAIVDSQAASLGDLLRGRAGINISNQGGDGKLTSVFVRGGESDHVLVLVDGIRIGSATSGAAAFQDLPLALIDRIEIVRGPRSSLYGSDAIGGVIQIFTRHDRGPAQFRFDAGFGSHNRREAGVGVGGSGELGWYGIDAAYLRTDGINACNGAGFPVFAGCFTEEPDRDGYRHRAFSLRGGVHLGESAELSAQWLDVRGHNEYDGSFVNNSDIVQRAIGANLRWQANDRLALQFGIGRNRDASDNFLDSAARGSFASDRDSVSVQADVDLEEGHVFSLGADWLRDRVDSDTLYDKTSRRNSAVFMQYQAHFGAQDAQLALRRDDNEQFGGKTTGTAAWGIDIGEHWRATASYGTAFKAPTFNDLYFPPFFGFRTSNPDLKPERSKSWEIGVAWRSESAQLHLNAFETRARDVIALDGFFIPQNLDRARIRGAELQFDSKLFDWDFAAAASWLDARNRTRGDDFGNDLPRRARETARLSLDRGFGKFRFGLTGIGESGRYDDIANRRRLGGYATLDVRAEYAFDDRWRLQANIANVFDRNYETAAFYNQPGRTFNVHLRYAPPAR